MLVALPAAAVPTPAEAARAGTLSVRLQIESPAPREFVVDFRGQAIRAVDGAYAVPLDPGDEGGAVVTVRALRADGTPGPWLTKSGEGVYDYTWGQGSVFEVDGTRTTIGPLRIAWTGTDLPPLPDVPIGEFGLSDITGSVAMVMVSARLYDVPAGTTTVLQFLGCAGDAPVATFTSRETGLTGLFLSLDGKQLGARGRMVVTVRRPGETDYVLSLGVPTEQRCDPATLLDDDVDSILFGFDEVDGANGFPVWHRGAVNPVPAAAVTWRRVRPTVLRAGRPVTPVLTKRVLLNSYDEHYRWTVGGRTVKGKDGYLRLRRAWVGKAVKVTVTVDPEFWDGTLSRTVRLGRVRR